MSMSLPVHPRRLFLGLTLCLGLIAPLLFPASTLALASWPVGANSATIGAGGGTVGIVGSVVTVVIPAGALDTAQVVTLAALPTSPLPDPVPTGLVLTGQPVTVGLPALVTGATAQLTLPVDSSSVPAGYQLAVLRSGVWLPLPTTMTDSSDVVATITAGGTYAPFALTANLLPSPGVSPAASSATPALTPAPSPSLAAVVAPASPKATPRAPATSLPLEPSPSATPGVGIYIALLGLMALILLMEFRGLRAGRSTVFRRRYR